MHTQTICDSTDLLVFSHLRWNFVFQRPQHLLSRFAKYRRVYFFEEPIFSEIKIPCLNLQLSKEGVEVVVPHLPHGLSHEKQLEVLKDLVDDLVIEEDLRNYSLWYYTPMALPFSKHLKPSVVLYDMMDELSLFKGAPASLVELESELMDRADVVFTGGHSLYESKQHRHSNIHPVPSSIDYSHFSRARENCEEPADQANIPHPRVGFFGVIDERMNIELLGEAAKLRPDLQFVILGPVVKIDPASLPKESNIHYLGQKCYSELPSYLAGWDCAILPFALNDSTRFISPTKTPEYLAGGCPVVSTSIRDVVRPYAENNLVHIADCAKTFVDKIDAAIMEKRESTSWLHKVDQFLANISWDLTWQKVAHLELSTSLNKSLEFFPTTHANKAAQTSQALSS